jgi:hypothetical protein
MTRYLLLFGSYGFVFVERPVWQVDGSVFCICCWPLAAQSFSGPSSLGLATIFYSLRFETSLFVASYPSTPHYRLSLYRLRTDHAENTCQVSEWLFIGPLLALGMTRTT